NGGVTDASFELIPPEVATALDTALKARPAAPSTVVQATFTVVGDLAGSNVTSQEFHYSVTLGHQILIDDRGLCSTVKSSFMARTGNPCFPGQDFVIDCCTSPTQTPICPAVGTAP